MNDLQKVMQIKKNFSQIVVNHTGFSSTLTATRRDKGSGIKIHTAYLLTITI